MTKAELFACSALAAFIGVGFIAGATTASAAFNKVEQRLAYRNCLLSQTVEVCTVARPLGAIK